MTLIEVVAGLVLLATVFAAVAVARGRFVRQWSDADRLLRATRAADALLANWLGGAPGRVPIRGGGSLAETGGYTWQTRPVREPGAERLGAQVVRLEVFGPPGAESPAGDPSSAAATGRSAAAALTVDFLVRAGAAAGEASPVVPGVRPPPPSPEGSVPQ